MKFWVGVSAAFGAGTLIGFIGSSLLLEDKLKKEYEESTATMRRAFEAARIDRETSGMVDGPYPSERDLDEIYMYDSYGNKRGDLEKHDAVVNLSKPLDGGSVLIQQDMPAADTIAEVVEIPKTNPYHKVVESTTNIYASYAELDEEEYYDEDGRVKDDIEMIFDDNQPRFFNQGEEIDDAFERVGSTVVDDMRKAMGEGKSEIFIRNNQTEVDYRVVFNYP